MKKSIVEKALNHPKVVDLITGLILEQMEDLDTYSVKKPEPNQNMEIEELIACNNIVFADEGSETGEWLTVKQIANKVSEFNENHLRPRIFGKFLKEYATNHKSSSNGTKYFVELISGEIDELDPNDLEVKGVEKINPEDVDASDIDNVPESKEKKKKKDKKKDKKKKKKDKKKKK